MLIPDCCIPGLISNSISSQEREAVASDAPTAAPLVAGKIVGALLAAALFFELEISSNCKF
jgi:hypothetical protein